MSNVTSILTPLHLVSPVYDIAATCAFYGGIPGCSESRSSSDWVDFNFYGHQIVAHLTPDEISHHRTSAVDGDNMPMHHFGAVLSIPEWEAAIDKLRAASTGFIIEPRVRFRDEVGEQATIFFLDPSGNAMGIKVLASVALLFAKWGGAARTSLRLFTNPHAPCFENSRLSLSLPGTVRLRVLASASASHSRR